MQYFYVVRPDDSLFKIAKRRGISIESLIAANNLSDPNAISVGQQLSIPASVTEYRVQSGDSVYLISQYFGMPISMIVEANELKPPYMLQVNQLLKIPPGVPDYVVQKGDTLEQVAERYNVTTNGVGNPKLVEDANQLTTTNLEPGTKLTIPYRPTGEKGFIAYTSNRGGEFDIWVYNLRNGDNSKLTNDLADSFSKPVWSPDSNRIAFVGKDRIIYVIYVSTGLIAAIDQLTEGGDFNLDWSANSSSLAYVARGVIVLYNATLHEAFQVDQPGASNVNWFPSGGEILFQALDESGISQLYRCEVSGMNKKQITKNTEGPLHDARLSPDGTFVLYTTPGASISIIHTVELSTGKVYEVKGGPEAKNYYPEWSPDSLQIAYSATSFDNESYLSQIRTTGRLGDNEWIWAISNCFSTPITWSPDGENIAYLSGCKEQEFANEMWVFNRKHPDPVQLTKGFTIMSLQWSPTELMDLGKKEYTNAEFDVNFQYPSGWERVSDERYEGSDGFFQISAIWGSDNIEEVCHDEAYQELMPYGSSPQIIESKNQYNESCTIFPSADQPTEMKGQAAFIARYPSPITIGDENYNYFILWANKEHIDDISSTVLFLP